MSTAQVVDLTPATVNIRLYRGDQRIIPMRYKEPAPSDVGIDITGYTITGQIRERPDAVDFTDLDVAITDAVEGRFTVAQPNSAIATVTNKALTSNVATLTTSAAHGFIVGDSVAVVDVDDTFDGTSVELTAVTATTLSYATTAPNVASVASTGTVGLATPLIGYFDIQFKPLSEGRMTPMAGRISVDKDVTRP